jgi:hypothetical protein
MFWYIVIGLVICSGFFITIILMNAPLMPDDYGLTDEDIWPLDQRPHVEYLDDKTLNELVDEHYANEKNT